MAGNRRRDGRLAVVLCWLRRHRGRSLMRRHRGRQCFRPRVSGRGQVIGGQRREPIGVGRQRLVQRRGRRSRRLCASAGSGCAGGRHRQPIGASWQWLARPRTRAGRLALAARVPEQAPGTADSGCRVVTSWRRLIRRRGRACGQLGHRPHRGRQAGLGGPWRQGDHDRPGVQRVELGRAGRGNEAGPHRDRVRGVGARRDAHRAKSNCTAGGSNVACY